MVGAGSGNTRNRLILSLRLSLPACSLISAAVAVMGFVNDAMRYRESAEAWTPGAICPRPLSRTTSPCWLMETEHAAVDGIDSASNAVESDDFRSAAVAGIGDGPVGIDPFPQAIVTAANRMTKYVRTLDQLEGR